MADEEREYQPTLAERIADAIPTELTATPHVAAGAARRAKIAAVVMPVVLAELDKIRAEVAEGIAQAIEAKARRDKHGVTAWVYGYRDGLDDAAALARGYAHGTGTPHDDPAQPEQGRDKR